MTIFGSSLGLLQSMIDFEGSPVLEVPDEVVPSLVDTVWRIECQYETWSNLYNTCKSSAQSRGGEEALILVPSLSERKSSAVSPEAS